MVKLRSLKQLGMVSDYLNHFKTLLAKVEINESYVVHLFVSGLHYHIQNSVRMYMPKSLVHAFALARLQESSLNFRGIYYADLEVKDELWERGSDREGLVRIDRNGDAQETKTKFNSLKFKEELHSITAPEIAIQLSKNSSSTLGGGSNPDMDDVDVDDVVWNKSIGVLQGKILDVGHNLVGYPRAEGLAVAEVKGADLLSRVPAPHLEFGGWKKYLNFRDELLKDTQGSLRDMNVMVLDAVHTAPKVLHKWIEEPRHHTTRILQVAREHIYKTERCLLYSMRMFGNDILSPFASGTILNEVVGGSLCQNGDKQNRIHVEDHLQLHGDESRSRSVERGKRNIKHQLIKQELISQVGCLAPPLCLVTEFMSSGRVFDELQNRKMLVQLGIMTAEAEIWQGFASEVFRQKLYNHNDNVFIYELWSLNITLKELRIFEELELEVKMMLWLYFWKAMRRARGDIASRSYSSVQKVVIEKDALSRVHSSDIVISLGRRKGGSLQESFEVYEIGCSKLGQRKLFFQLLETILKLGNRGNGESNKLCIRLKYQSIVLSASFGFSKECFNFLL
ncbi:hypothetical protein SASPL_137481 [Salvia splendens]|uniref:Uncharacterized protein n=1 Tax=Salvia splendens TaxID=180675 RepID=A0A8X8WUF8_SALSN|nr:hypothetical protein SASPL_137481 [Salvia splendens]